MTKGGSKYMKIKIKTETGEVVKITDENNNNATQITPAELEQMYQSQNGFRYVGVILHTHSSPECICLILPSGRAVKICW